jgi:hypothetical protein
VRIRLAVAVAGLVAVGGAAAASAAAPPPLPISITHDDRGVCVTISLQTTHCVPTDAIPQVGVSGQALPGSLPIGLPYQKGDEICYDPTPTSKGPCIPLN